MSATYGANCHAPEGNATGNILAACEGLKLCDYVIDVRKLGDPAPNCGKSFIVSYMCPHGREAKRAEVQGEAGLGKHVVLSCP